MIEQTALPLIIDIDDPRFFVNQSRWKSYQDCNRMYGWEHVEGLVPERTKKHFAIGTAIHKAQEYAHTKGGGKEAFDEALKIAQTNFTKSMQRGPQLPGDEAELQSGLKTISALLPAYYKHYEDKGTLWKPLGVELSFCVEVGEGTNIWLVGRIDNLVTFMNGLWLVDYKTMNKLDLREFMKYEIDVQLTAYIYGGTKQLTLDARAKGQKAIVIRGAIIDGIVKTEVPQFHREMYTRSLDDLREFEVEFCMKAWEMAAKHALTNKNKKLYDYYTQRIWDLGVDTTWKTIFPKNTQQCFRYGTCTYRDLCVKDNETRRITFKQRAPDYVNDARKIATEGLKDLNVEE